MRALPFKRHRFPAEVIRHAVWFYFRFTLSFRDVEELLAQRAVDDEGEVLDLVMQRRRDTNAALKLLKRLLRNQPVDPVEITTDGLGSYVAVLKELDLISLHHPGRLRENNRAENSHLPIRRREGKMQGSNPRRPPSASSPPMLRPTTPSTPSPI